MFTLIKKFLTDPNAELREKLDLEQDFFDQQLAEEMEQKKKALVKSCMHNVINKDGFDPIGNEGNNQIENTSEQCFTRVGTITAINNEKAVIDNFITFDLDTTVANDSFGKLQVDDKVEYLCYNKGDFIKVIKFTKVFDSFWNTDDVDAETDSNGSKASDRNEEVYSTQHRSVLGLIKERRPTILLIDTDYNTLTVDLEKTEIGFSPRAGDRVTLLCVVQIDNAFVDGQGEILEVLKVEPSRIISNEKCVVERIKDDIILFNNNSYMFKSDLKENKLIHLGDIIRGDLIECDLNNLIYRVISCEMMEKNFGALKSTATISVSKISSNQAISFIGSDKCIIKGLDVTKNVEIIMKNNTDHIFRVKRIEFDKHHETQLKLIEPQNTNFALNEYEARKLIFEVKSKFVGESKEIYIIKFDTFRITRMLIVAVCATDEEFTEAQKHVTTSFLLPCSSGRSHSQRSRHYANAVWSKKLEVVPGECIATKRRFVAVRIGYFEVPEKLRHTYLTHDRRSEMVAHIEALYPCLQEKLSYENYVERFQLLVHLEEIEYFVNFRNYDRERAHFVRDGEFLSLTIENLAERRPSIVIGDIVRAINPFNEIENECRSFEGIVHKVLYNRILLKFNYSFQEKYNGEDYRLEFYFSRFGFRKQHHSLVRAVKLLNENFLFPCKVTIRNNPQLDVRMDENGNLHLYDSILPWYNNELNHIQKFAVYNILRGEVDHMPYVIFGPPGTGKTVTVVETILQLVRNLPSSRLLVGTPSNSSADLITKRIIESGVLQQGDFVRLVSQNQIEKDLIPSALMSYCATVDIGSDGTCQDNMIVTESGLKLRCQMKYLGRHRITISTCTTLGNFLQMNFPSYHFTHLLIDEAGQCTEPESIVPITLVSKHYGQIIFAGDPHQLQAIVINRYAGENGYSVSMLERILQHGPYKKDLIRFPNTSGYDPRLMTKLLYNYRAIPSIMAVYNDLFYDSELISMFSNNSPDIEMLEKMQNTLPQGVNPRTRHHGVFFYGLRSENMQEEDSPSWYNPIEAKQIFCYTLQLYRLEVKPDDIGILTPYMKQVKHIRDLFITADIAMPKIGSVEEFQGQERKVILVSTVRSTESHLESDSHYSLGFVRCVKRMNVAISRARIFMVIFGNPHLLTLDDYWCRLIRFAYDNGGYIGCDLPQRIHCDDVSDTVSDGSELSDHDENDLI